MEQRIKSYPVDGKKMKKLFSERNILLATASKKMGYASNYLSCANNRGELSAAAAHLLQAYFNSYPEAYAPDKEQAEAPKEVNTTLTDYKQLYQVIYTAVYEAMKKALNE